MLFYFHIVKFLRFSLSISNICAACSFAHICLGVFPSGEVLVCFWIFWCGNILLLTITFFCVADFNTARWRAVYCWLPATAYSTYWQVPFISWGIFCVCNYRIWHGITTRTHMTGFFKNISTFCTHHFICLLIAVNFYSHTIPFPFYLILTYFYYRSATLNSIVLYLFS